MISRFSRYWAASVMLAAALCQPAAAKPLLTLTEVLEEPRTQTMPFRFTIPDGTGEVWVDWVPELQQGEAKFEMRGPDGETVVSYEWGHPTTREADFPIPSPGEHEAVIEFRDAVGRYDLVIRPAPAPGAMPTLASGVGMLWVALAALLIWWISTRGSLRWVMWGGIAWVVSVAVKFGIAGVCNGPVLSSLHAGLPQALYVTIGATYIGLLTGITEVVAGYWIAKRLKYTGRSQSTGFGLGFGVVEAALLGLAAAVAGLAAALAPDALAGGAIDQLEGTTWAQAGAPVATRVLAIIVHLACGVMVVRSVAAGRLGWFWGAFAYKSAVDAVAGAQHLSGAVETWTPWVLTAPFVPLALIGIILIWAAWRRWPEVPGQAMPDDLTA